MEEKMVSRTRDLRVVQVIWDLAKRHRWLLPAAFLGGIVVGVPAAWLVPEPYVASMTVTSARYSQDTGASNTGAGGALSLFSQFSSSSQLPDFDLYLQMMTSTDVSAKIFRDNPDLVRRIFRAEWRGDHWQRPDTFRFSAKEFLDSLIGVRTWAPPDALRLSEMLKSLVSVDKDARTPIATITVRSTDRALALDILKNVHAESEAMLKMSAESIRDAKAEFLAALLKRTSAITLSDAVMQSQIREEIGAALSRSPAPFAAQFISAPNAPIYPNHRPRRQMPIITGLFVLLVTFGVLLWREWRRRNPHFKVS